MTTRPVHSTFSISSGFRTPERPDHDGIDFAAPFGTPIFAPIDGMVIEGADRPPGSVSGFGNWVWLDAQDTHGVDLVFGHMRHASILVKRGDRVREGEQIASVGSEGESTGPHLHFEVWGPPGRLGGDPRNPQDFLQDAVDPGTQPGPGTDGGASDDFPLPRGFFYGPLEGPDSSISGRHGSERPEWIAGLKRWQQAQGVPQTGVYDKATADAARAVQLANGLTPDGLIDPATWRAGITGPGTRPTERLQLVDHAAARPGARAVKADGYHGAVRYLVDSPERGLVNKKLTPEEAAGYLELDMPLVSNWQKGKHETADWRRGFDGGVADAKAADAWHKHCGGPPEAPIFFSIDDDLSLSEWNSLASHYLRGAASVLGKQRVGAYCKYLACDWAVEDDVVGTCRDGSGKRYLWQPNTWLGSRPLGTISEHACLFQRLIHPRDDIKVAGINVDVNDTLTEDFGQWHYVAQLPVPVPVAVEPIVVRAPEGYDIAWHDGPGHRSGHGPYKRIYLHTTENQDWITRAENVADWQARQQNGSYHYMVDDNHIIQTVSTKNAAWGVPVRGLDDDNHVSVQIALVGTSGAIPRWTGSSPNVESNPKQRQAWLEHDKMLDMVAYTIAKVSKDHNIPIERVDIAGVGNDLHGVSSHNNYTYGSVKLKGFQDGTHWDVPDTFPYDVVFAAAKQYASVPDDPDRFPLPDGHYWGPLEGPEESWSNLFGNEPQSSKDGLKRWQAALDIPQTSVYDGATRDAAKTMQQAKGWPITGHVYAGEWYGVIKDGWRLPTPQPAMLATGARKIKDATGPGHTDRFGMAATDLGVMTRTPSGRILAVFGDTFRDPEVGSADWRSPVALLSETTNLDDGIEWHEAAGPDPHYARQLWPYDHAGGTTALPSDVITIGQDIFLHVMINQGLGNVVRTEIWTSSDDGKSWQHSGAQFDAGLHGGFAQLWTWARDDDGWVYVFSTGFQRDKGVILRRVREDQITDPGAYVGWGWRDGQWNWGNPPTPVLEREPSAEKFGEMCLRKIENKWALVNFDASTIGGYDIDLRILDTPTDNLYLVPKTTPLRGSSWSEQGGDKIAQLYGPSIIPGSTLDAGLHLLVSQWKTADGWPYRAMHFKIPVG
ncbi:DUF4185 domain-containing protein [Nocardia sp. bgisy134]|uniref:DUF4185 domain-containing protein n=1 Tax=Nocardia sp. bgisy134 TaxID=3413789 RepID=UPI003D72EBFD